MPENRFRSQLPAALLLSALLAATIALIEPAKSAIGNWSEIGIGFAELLARLAVPFAVAFFAIATFAVLLAAAAPRRAIPMLVALYVALWAQGSLFVWEYGSFDASPIDWNEHSGKGLLEMAFWAATLALALTKHEWIRRRALPITAIVLGLQLAALADHVHQNAPFPEPSDSETSVVHAKGVTDLSLIRSVSLFSRDLNVIIIVLDALQSDFFSEAMRDPELRAAMPPGFTYFRNAVSLYASTPFSLQTMLTSRALPDNVNTRQWRREHAPGALPARLAERGFDAVLTTYSHSIYTNFGMWGYRRVLNSTLAGLATARWREDVSNMFALGLFRLLPHFLKPRIYDDGSWQTSQLYPPLEAASQDPRIFYDTRMDLAAFDELIASASADDTAPRFRLLHFYGTHRSYTVDESCSYPSDGDTRISRKNVITVTHCMLSRLFEFLHKLDEIGVYDQSLIFVVADHGEKYVPLDVSAASPGLPESGAPHDAANHREATRIDHPWRGVPLFLAKPLGDRQPLRVSDLPVSLCDIPKSVSDALSIEHDFGCESIFSERSPRQAPRMHYRYLSFADRRSLGQKGLVFEKFTVVGHSWLPESWIPFDADESEDR
jgi:hypothetical protein